MSVNWKMTFLSRKRIYSNYKARKFHGRGLVSAVKKWINRRVIDAVGVSEFVGDECPGILSASFMTICTA